MDTPLQSRQSAFWFVVLGVAALALSMLVLPGYSSFTASVLKGALVVGFAVAYDALVLRRSNSHEQVVEQQNLAYAVFHGMVVVAIAIAIASA